MTALTAPDDKRTRILMAALAVFGRYGYRRASMEDIAAEAGISRAALYLLFRNKEDIFRSGSAMLHDDANRAAAAAFAAPGPFAQRLRAALAARHGAPYAMLANAQHGLDLLTQHGSIAADVAAESDAAGRAIFAAAIAAAAKAGELDLKRAGLTAPRLAALLQKAANGLKADLPTAAAYDAGLADLATLTLAAAASRPR